MLSPVAAVSVVGASIEKPVVATAETSSVQAAATPVAVLSSAVNASAGGKLNMLLAAARERMFESLLSAIDAASVALNVPREPGESNAALAQRLVDAIRSLPPQQLAAAQQQLNAQMKTPVPLPLLAEALDNPDSPKAVQIAVSLDASLTQEPDAVIRAVVNSYGQNAGEPDAVGQQTPIPAQAMPKTSEAAATSTATTAPSALPEKMAAPSPTPVTASPSTPSAQAPQQAATTILQTIAGPVVIPVPEVMPDLAAAVTPQTAPNPQVSATPQAASMPAAERGVLPQIAVIVEDKALPTASLPLAAVGEAKLPTEIALIRSPLTPPPVPRDIQQLQADIKQGLQVVISPAIDVTGPDLPQVTRSDMPLAERVIAQTLAAGQQDLQPLPQTVRDESLRNLAAALAGQTAASSEEAQTAPAAALPVKSQGNVPAMTIMDMSEAVAQTGTTIAPLLGIPFAIAHYLPADTPTEDDPKRVDRVDLVDEEREQGQGGETARDDSEDESPPEEADQPAAAAADPAAEDANVDVISASAIPVAPKIAALPAPAPVDPLSDHAFDFYRRMVGWE
ncbi:hypothetical protein G6L33_00240 [Agrobacterium rhizogenes]|nr:hypothetical protein [Rhizobium rhizogenes]NTF72897.1 hypothetical protein [Rhizobium rhizogenes]NTG12179.1 hypothetical protein [Rhizobium rhizogenes]NTG25585.1 hypothetical protein [Rhizobium rhizogenes]NTH62272.1 hypothetical protein [Rhizobium rhizogenes]